MPYCEDCEKYWTPSSVNADGSCRTCGRQLAGPRLCPSCGADQDDPTVGDGVGPDDAGRHGDAGTRRGAGPATTECWNCHEQLVEIADTAGDADDDKVPWHFKLMIVALVVYLGWRFVELGMKIFG